MIYHAMEAAKVGNIAEVIVAGDTPLDIQAANNGGVRGVGVLSGPVLKPDCVPRSPRRFCPAWLRFPQWGIHPRT